MGPLLLCSSKGKKSVYEMWFTINFMVNCTTNMSISIQKVVETKSK